MKCKICLNEMKETVLFTGSVWDCPNCARAVVNKDLEQNCRCECHECAVDAYYTRRIPLMPYDWQNATKKQT
jgi:hypothetical protein